MQAVTFIYKTSLIYGSSNDVCFARARSRVSGVNSIWRAYPNRFENGDL